MEDLSTEPVSYFFLQDEYPEDLETHLDQHIREQIQERFRRRFSRRERSRILGGLIGNRHYTEDNINEIADERGHLSNGTSIKTGAEKLLEEYNERVDGSILSPIDEAQFVEMELGWIADELLEEAEVQHRAVQLGDGTTIGYDDGRYASFTGQPVRLGDMEEIASVIDDEIKFEHFRVGEGATSSYHHTAPEDYESFVKFDHDLPYGRLRAHRNGSGLRVTDYSEKIPDIVDAIQAE